jgi:protein FRA10AC1
LDYIKLNTLILKFRSQSHSEYDTDEEDRRKGKTRKSKLESADREGKDDENFDEYMEGMFPGNG